MNFEKYPNGQDVQNLEEELLKIDTRLSIGEFTIYDEKIIAVGVYFWEAGSSEIKAKLTALGWSKKYRHKVGERFRICFLKKVPIQEENS